MTFRIVARPRPTTLPLMDRVRRHRWHAAVDDLLTRPLLERAVLVMVLFTIGHVLTAPLSLWTVHRSGQVLMVPFASVVVAGILVVGTSAFALAVVAKDDPHGSSRAARGVLATTAAAYPLFGIAVAQELGFWASPFALFPAVTVLIFGVVFGRAYGWFALGTSISAAAVLEGLRLAGVVDYAPALVERSVDGSGELWRVAGTSIPLVVFTTAAVGLCYGVLATVDRQRDALATTHEVLTRYVPAQVADAVLVGGEEVTRLERRKLTVFFSDVVGFTETTDRMEPEELAVVLDDYFSEMTRIAARYDGTVDELIGDAVLIFFGAPTATDDRDHAVRAVRMAVEMQRAVADLNERWASLGIDAEFRIRMGINTGVVAVGNVGSGSRRKYAALGRGVNLASRVQTYCPPGEVLLSHATWLLVRDAVPCEPRGEVELKGVGRPVRLYAVDGDATALDG